MADLTPTKPGFYWAQWRTAVSGTRDAADLTPSDEWAPVQVFENALDEQHPEYLMVEVGGVEKAQGLDCFVWGQAISRHGAFDMLAHLQRQRDWSCRTFGPGTRTKGVVDHIRKELREIEADPSDISEWIDVTILALDGAWRAGHTPDQIIAALVAKQSKNEARDWPDWRTADPDKAIEHVRDTPALCTSSPVGQRIAAEGKANG